MKDEVCSWRLSRELRSDLERAARLRKVPVSSILESAVRDLLKKEKTDNSDEEMQRELHKRVERCIGTINGGNPHRAETARQAIRQMLKQRHGR